MYLPRRCWNCSNFCSDQEFAKDIVLNKCFCCLVVNFLPWICSIALRRQSDAELSPVKPNLIKFLQQFSFYVSFDPVDKQQIARQCPLGVQVTSCQRTMKRISGHCHVQMLISLAFFCRIFWIFMTGKCCLVFIICLLFVFILRHFAISRPIKFYLTMQIACHLSKLSMWTKEQDIAISEQPRTWKEE